MLGNYSISIVCAPPLFKGGGLKNFGSETKGGAGKKFLKGGGSIQKGVPLLKGGAGKVKIKFP